MYRAKLPVIFARKTVQRSSICTYTNKNTSYWSFYIHYKLQFTAAGDFPNVIAVGIYQLFFSSHKFVRFQFSFLPQNYSVSRKILCTLSLIKPFLQSPLSNCHGKQVGIKIPYLPLPPFIRFHPPQYHFNGSQSLSINPFHRIHG